MLIQVLLLLSVVALLVLFVRRGNGVHVAASKRVGLVIFAVANVYAVLRPDHLTVVAQLLGVGRGTDLVLYGLVVAFLFAMLSFYLRFRAVDQRLTDLARSVALREAELVNRERALFSGER